MQISPAGRPSDRLLWITPDRAFYAGLLGAPATRTMGAVMAYVATEGAIRVSIGGGPWQATQLAVIPPYLPHRVVAEARLINVVKLEADTVHPAALPAPLRECGAVDAPGFVEHVRRCRRELCEPGRHADLMALDFDRLFFGQAIPVRPIDERIRALLPPFFGDVQAEVKKLNQRVDEFKSLGARVEELEKRVKTLTTERDALLRRPGEVASKRTSTKE